MTQNLPTTAAYRSTIEVPLDELTPYPGNAKRGDVPTILDSLRRNGQYRSLIVREIDNGPRIILAGNHTHMALAEHGPGPCDVTIPTNGGTRPCAICTGKPWAPVARVELITCDDNTARRINLVDNRSADNGTYDNDALAELLSHLDDDLEGTGYTQEDIAYLLNHSDPTSEALTDPDDTPQAPADPISKPGDIWILGPHRLMCGDSINPNDLARLTEAHQPNLIYTDPPYGIKAVPKDGGASRAKLAAAQAYTPVAGDDTTDIATDAFRLLTTEYPQAKHVWWGGNHYAASANLPDSSCWLIWDKENHGNDFADAELAWTNHTGAVRLLRHMWNGMLRASEREKRVHPTQKPVALAEWAFSIVDPEHTREVVLDVFGGSGSTLLACHATGRTGLLMETEPAYIDVICRRYQQHTGTLPVLNSTGEAHSFTAASETPSQ